MRERLIELISQCNAKNLNMIQLLGSEKLILADYLLDNGVVVPMKIKGYNDYFIDEYGNVYSVKTHKYLNQEKGKDGYYYVQLCEKGKRKRVSVHRLVAETFIENPCSLPMVNHKDENRENNDVKNLEWCTEKYNANYGTARIRQAQSISKAVVCIETGEVFLSQKSAESKVGKCYRHICDCCKGKKQTCGGYHWRYATREEAEILSITSRIKITSLHGEYAKPYMYVFVNHNDVQRIKKEGADNA